MVRQVDVVPLIHVYLKNNKTQPNIVKGAVVRQVDVVLLVHVYIKNKT